MAESVTNQDILKIMIDGGEQLCNEAMSKWMNPEYCRGLEDIAPERKRWWSEARRQVRIFAKEIKEWQKTLA